MSSQENYLAAKVHTASQVELNLMLNDGAVRFVRQALAAWDEAEEDADVDRLLNRALDALEALVQGCASGSTEISKQLEEQYAFCYRELAAGRLNRDRRRIESTLELLIYERETWRLASEQSGPADAPADAPTPSLPALAHPTPARSSLSLEA